MPLSRHSLSSTAPELRWLLAHQVLRHLRPLELDHVRCLRHLLLGSGGDGCADDGADKPAAIDAHQHLLAHERPLLVERLQRWAGRRFFDLPVSARPGGSEEAGGREKTKTENTGGPGGHGP